MGGGTGSGAAPVVARYQRKLVILLLVLSPIHSVSRAALEALEKLENSVDTLIVIPNDKLLDVVDENMPLQDAFLLADDVLRQGVQGISDIITIPGLANVDFADVKAVMKNSGTATLGVGVSSSKNRAQEAAEQATLATLIGSSIEATSGVVYNITGGKDITLQEVNKVSQIVTSLADPSANIIFGGLGFRVSQISAVVDDRYTEIQYSFHVCSHIYRNLEARMTDTLTAIAEINWYGRSKGEDDHHGLPKTCLMKIKFKVLKNQEAISLMKSIKDPQAAAK
ncbi:Cell division protein FtsZ 1, chloroplastic [Zea mays]|uniref:Cell division protein FtsZ 1, chloroplastic n=1 Tax=Zea mays TaxID=4577 RepID=A0A3L6GEE3_MAIZE|nr:Cell division protein FtsZ 1, chloroplastic [Zea mays]